MHAKSRRILAELSVVDSLKNHKISFGNIVCHHQISTAKYHGFQCRVSNCSHWSGSEVVL